ncbi:transcription termination factor NusA [Candidatus Paracaedibacter symbiosus]|uniref:transcription termination factor NusA n=1 Tax=Candidatus Paracaedibacter symbiosus TaxID=244582 RepID=UPI000A051E77|nr:transcription termination factor NusA [Candidatus Paracaedibacter symbiosus]
MTTRKIKTTDHTSNLPRHELLHVAEAVAREKSIDREEVLSAMEQAIQKAAKAKYGYEHDIRAVVNRNTGEVSIFKGMTVVDVVEDPHTEISLTDAKLEKENAVVGDVLEERLPPVEFGRVAAQSARQVIFQKVRDAERARQYEEFKDKGGQIISGTVKRVEFGNVIVDLGRAEGILRRDDIIQRETFRSGDRIRAYIADVRPDARGPLVALSRTHPQFMARLFEQEVPEIYDGIIEIKSVARDPGSRAKLAVFTNDASIDPVGACVGMRGARVQAVVTELQGEKVDIVLWSANPATFVVNALAPAEVVKVVLDEENHRVDVVVGEDQLSLAIGRRGQNVRLASHLTGWNIDVLTESQEATRRTEEYASRTQLFMDRLDVDEMIAQLLAAEGFNTLEELILAPIDELTAIEGFDEDIARELQTRAIVYLEAKSKESVAAAKKLGIQEDLLSIEDITPEMFVKLAENGVKTLDDFADLAGDELVEIVGPAMLTIEKANEMIMAARAHWFEDEQQ